MAAQRIRATVGMSTIAPAAVQIALITYALVPPVTINGVEIDSVVESLDLRREDSVYWWHARGGSGKPPHTVAALLSRVANRGDLHRVVGIHIDATGEYPPIFEVDERESMARGPRLPRQEDDHATS